MTNKDNIIHFLNTIDRPNVENDRVLRNSLHNKGYGDFMTPRSKFDNKYLEIRHKSCKGDKTVKYSRHKMSDVRSAFEAFLKENKSYAFIFRTYGIPKNTQRLDTKKKISHYVQKMA